MKKNATVLLCGVAVMAVTIILYFVILGNIFLEAIHLISLIAVLLAEGITTAYACCANGSPRKVAAAVVSAFAIPFAAILSIVYIVAFPKGYGAYLGLYFAGLIVMNTVALLLCFFDSRKSDKNDRLQAAKSNMLELRKLVKCILADPAADAYRKELEAIEEKLHFSNDSVIVPEDEQIRLLLLQLQERIADPQADSQTLIAKIKRTIDDRSILTARNA